MKNGFEASGEFTDRRYAVFFMPGDHDVTAQCAYYTTFHGLGDKPDDTNIQNLYCGDGSKKAGALNNFWRSVENLAVGKGQSATWAVS